MKAILLFIALGCFLSANGLKWIGYGASGNEVERTINVIASPDMGNPHTYAVLATQREVRTNAKGQHVGKVVDAIEFTFSTIGIPHFTIRHFARSNDQVEARAARHAFRKIVEYVNVNADPGFQPENDTKVQSFYFWLQTWSPLAVSTTTTANGATVTSICTHTANNVVDICAYLADIATELTVNGSVFQLDDQAIHHTLSIDNFPFIDTNSQLAIKAHFEAKTRVADYNNTDPKEAAMDLSDAGDDHHPVVAWNTYVNVTGTGCAATAPVQREIIRLVDSINDTDTLGNAIQFTDQISFSTIIRITYFSFLTGAGCEPTQIFWDPDLGLVDDSSAAFVVVPSFFFVAFFAIFNLF